MKSNKSFLLVLLLLFLAGCGSGGGATAKSVAGGKALVSLEIAPANQKIAQGTTQPFTAMGTYSDNSTADVTDSVTWGSTVTSVATISNTAGSIGKATAVGVGATTITATSGGVSTSTTLTVTSATLVSIAITPADASLALGLTHNFTAKGTFSDNTTQDITDQVAWTSSDPSFATINANGVATAVATGTTTITATSGTVTGSTTLTVTGTTLVSISVQPDSPSIALGSSQNFKAIGTYSNNITQDLTSSVTWSSSNTSVATVSNSSGSNGTATSKAAGSTTITATMATTQPLPGAIYGTTTLTVTPATLVSIAVTPANAAVPLGGTQQFTATGTFTDGSTQDLTGLVTWASTAAGVATVSNASGANGKAASVAAGTTTISAAMTVTQPLPGTITGSTTLTVSGSVAANANVVNITVNGSLCSAGSYYNKPCVSVTVCTPGTSNCQTVSDILLDTGSVGLRIFKQALNLTLPQVTVGSRNLAECIQYADGSADWGPVQTANVTLGGEPAVQVPIQVIDATFGIRPSACQSADQSPSDAGFNGILGVGLWAQDCGSACTSSANIGLYYGCSGSSCSGTTVPLATQVPNPVALLPTDNNGVLLQLPSVSSTGASSVNGKLILGIGTQSNNTPPSGVTSYAADGYGEFTTIFNGSAISNSFIDSGSNGLFFDYSGLPTDYTGTWYSPSQTTTLSAVNQSAYGSPSGTVNFSIANYTTLVRTGNNVFNDLGGTGLGGFDWGLPFFLGRNVFVGLEGTNSSLGTGPFWAY